MAQGDRETPQTADNPNKAGQGPNKGDLKAGEIRWLTPPPGMEEHDGKLVPEGEGRRVNGDEDPATVKGLSRGQRRDLARRIRAKLSRKG
jgi:hypothetical protein